LVLKVNKLVAFLTIATGPHQLLVLTSHRSPDLDGTAPTALLTNAADTVTNRQTDRHTDRQTDRQEDRQTDRQTGRQTDRVPSDKELTSYRQTDVSSGL